MGQRGSGRVAPHAARRRVLLTTEGTYPYILGGVSSWCDLLVNSLTEFDWQVMRAYLVEPDFTTATRTPITTRGWVAWYTAAGGWHWLGANGENAGRWMTWTSTVSGIEQFHPGGSPTPVPWTRGPISVPTGQGIYAVGVYEIVYWVGGKPDYQWQYVNAGTTVAAAAGGGTLYCAY